MSVTPFGANLGTKVCSLVLDECPSLKATLRENVHFVVWEEVSKHSVQVSWMLRLISELIIS